MQNRVSIQNFKKFKILLQLKLNYQFFFKKLKCKFININYYNCWFWLILTHSHTVFSLNSNNFCFIFIQFELYYQSISFCLILILGKLQSWSLSFTSYLNLVSNLSIVSIWSPTFLLLCEFSPCHYHLDGKSWCVKQNNKKLFFMPHHLPTILPSHLLKKEKNEKKIGQFSITKSIC